MADSVEFSIGGDATAALREMQKLLKAQDQVIDGLQKQVKESKSAETAGVDMGHKVAREVENMAMKWMSLKAVIDLATGGVKAFLAEQERAAGITMSLAQRAAGLSGQLGMTTGQVMDWLKMRKPEAVGMKMEEQAAVLEAVTSAAPMATTETKLELSLAAMRSRMAGEKPAEFGKGLGGLYEVTGGKKSTGDLMDMMIAMRDMTGGRLTPDDARRLMSLGAEKGMSPEDVLGLATAGVKAGFDTRSLQEIIAATGPTGKVSMGKMGEAGKRAYKAIGAEAPGFFKQQYVQAQERDAYMGAEARAMEGGGFRETLSIQEIQARRERELTGRGMWYKKRREAAVAELGWMADVPVLGAFSVLAETLAPGPGTKARLNDEGALLEQAADSLRGAAEQRRRQESNPANRFPGLKGGE
jgi:hypothetical protein